MTTDPREFARKFKLAVRTVVRVRNWPHVLGNYAINRMGATTKVDVQVEFRDGTRVTCGAGVMSIAPVFEVLVEGAYRLSELGDLFADSSLGVVDVGAHVGSAALALSQVLSVRRMVCAEPSPSAATYLRRNLRENQIEAEVVEAAVGPHAGMGSLREEQPGSCENQVELAERVSEGPLVPSVPVVAFRDLLDQVGGGPIVVKMDCEGSEYAIVEGTPTAAWEAVQALLLEYHPVPGTGGWPWLSGRLHELGLQLLWHEPHPSREGLGTVCMVRRS